MDPQKPPSPSFDAAVRAYAAASRRDLTGHLSLQTLAEYREHALSAEEEERVREHLTLCPRCAEELVRFSAFADPEAAVGEPSLSDGDVAAAWSSLQARLAADSTEAAGEKPEPVTAALAAGAVPFPTPAVRSRSVAWTWALAASWLVAVGLGLWAVQLRLVVTQLSQPVVNPGIADLSSDTTRGAEPHEIPVLHHGGGFLVLSAAGLPVHRAYEADLVASSGQVLWTGRGLHRDPQEENFKLYLPPGSYKPGTYRIRLYGVEAGKRQLPPAELPFKIDPA